MQGTRMLIAGVGGAGCRIVDSLAAVAQSGPVFAAISTDSKALAGCRIATRLKIGAPRDGVFGTGGDPSSGGEAAESSREQIERLFMDVDLAFVIAGLGGGTGSGAVPVVLDVARGRGVMTIAVVTMPFPFEGQDRGEKAKQALDRVRQAADVVVVIPNARVVEDGETRLRDAMAKSTDIISTGINGIWKALARPAQLGFDFSDLQALVRETGGSCTFGFGDSVGKDRAAEAVQALMNSPMLARGELLAKASALVVSVIGGPDLTALEAEKIMKAVSEKAPESAHKLLGVMLDDNWRSHVTVTVMVSESWGDVSLPGERGAATTPAVAEAGPATARRRGRKPAATQTSLELDMIDKGRFKGVEPTYVDGDNLDTPTFTRRRISVKP